MVAQLLRLKLACIATAIRHPARGAARSVIGVLLVVLIVVGATRIGRVAPGLAWSLPTVSVLFGAATLLCCLLLPVATARDEALHARAFVGYGIRPTVLALILPLTDLVSLPALLLGILFVADLGAWAKVPGALGVATLSGLVGFVLCLLIVRLSSSFSSWLERRASERWVRALAGLLLIGGVLAALVAILRGPHPRSLSAAQLSDRIALTPLGALWNAPARATAGLGTAVPILVGLAVIVVLLAVFLVVVRAEVRGARPRRPRDPLIHLGVFRLAPSSPFGAIAARSIRYWVRDPRYSISLVVLPVVPALMIAAGLIGGIPISILALVPVPVVVVLVTWATSHNDLAYDSTAMWLDLVARVRGTTDRLGRAIPTLVLGLVITAVGVPIMIAIGADPAATPGEVGICLAALFGSVGVSSAVSARFPYPAPTPGSGGFSAPQSDESTGSWTQALSFTAVLLIAAPAVAATWAVSAFHLGGGANWTPLVIGIVVGGVALALGVMIGGRTFDRRGPETLAFAMRN